MSHNSEELPQTSSASIIHIYNSNLQFYYVPPVTESEQEYEEVDSNIDSIISNSIERLLHTVSVLIDRVRELEIEIEDCKERIQKLESANDSTYQQSMYNIKSGNKRKRLYRSYSTFEDSSDLPENVS